MPRYFQGPLRRAIFMLAKGQCNHCHAPLGADFHADHIKPFRQGGKTALNNGQALCPSCHGIKTASESRS